MKPKRLAKPTVSHYSNADVEPIDLIDSCNLDFFEGNIIKYVCRYKYKGGLLDLQKARQYLDWLIERVERDGSPT